MDHGRVATCGTVRQLTKSGGSLETVFLSHTSARAISTALDLSPAPAAAPAARRIIRHGLIETRLLIRNGEQLPLAL